jgi:hypothetical protein
MKGLGGFCFVASLALAAPSFSLEMDSGVSPEQARLLTGDLEYLNRIQYQDNEVDRETARLMRIRGRLTGAHLEAWLNERVSTVVSEDMNLGESLMVSRVKPTYPEPGVFPEMEKPPAPKPAASPAAPNGASEEFKPKVVMSNLGAGLYIMGKQRQILLALKKTDGKIHPILSPRRGVIQIGEGLFYKRFQIVPEHPAAAANSVSRISTLFHEARHSDGHGKTLAFGHAYCPEGHAYAGYPACDKNLNGPYTVGALILKTLAQGCGDCGIREKTILKAIEADARSRVLKTFKNNQGQEQKATVWSDTPEAVLKVTQIK